MKLSHLIYSTIVYHPLYIKNAEWALCHILTDGGGSFKWNRRGTIDHIPSHQIRYWPEFAKITELPTLDNLVRSYQLHTAWAATTSKDDSFFYSRERAINMLLKMHNKSCYFPLTAAKRYILEHNPKNISKQYLAAIHWFFNNFENEFGPKNIQHYEDKQSVYEKIKEKFLALRDSYEPPSIQEYNRLLNLLKKIDDHLENQFKTLEK